MTVRLCRVVVDAHEQAGPARWWAAVLDCDVLEESASDVVIGPAPDRYPGIVFVPVADATTMTNRLDPDLDPDDVQAEVARVVALGATPVGVGQDDAPWAVLADMDGKEFCVLAPHETLIA